MLVATLLGKVSVSKSIDSLLLKGPAAFNCPHILREQWMLLRFLVECTSAIREIGEKENEFNAVTSTYTVIIFIPKEGT